MSAHRGYFAILDANREFVEKNALCLTAPEIASKLGVSVSSVRKYRADNLGINAREIGRKYTEEMLTWLQENMTDYGNLAEQFNMQFGTSVDRGQIRNICNKYGFGNRDLYRPALVEKMREKMLEDYPIGTERTVAGWTYVKIGNAPQTGQGISASVNWKLKHYLIFEEAYGEIPPDHKVVFVDQDKSNFSLSNLVCVSNREQLLLTKCGWINGNPQMFFAGLAWVRLRLTLIDVQASAKQEDEK